MKVHSKIGNRLLVIVIMLGFGYIGQAMGQRLERPPARDVEGTAILPPKTNVIPAGSILILEMQTRLSSKTAHVSDRFRARVATPVIDGTGRILVPENSLVEGHVSSVTPAKWRRRSGLLAVTFDSLHTGQGKPIPIRGYLTSVDPEDRKRIDDEGTLKGKSLVKRDVVFVGGGTGAGAAIGAVTGGALVGAGIGAAAGLTATLLMKGKDAIVEEGQQVGLELTQDVAMGGPPKPGERPRPGGGTPPGQPGTDTGGGGGAGTPTRAGPVDVHDVRAERNNNGNLLILATARTPTAGWRIYTNHELTSDTVYVRLRGVPPMGVGAAMISHPTAPVIVIPDRNARFQRVVINGKNGQISTQVNGVPVRPRDPSTPSQPVDFPNTPPGTGAGTGNLPPPSSGTVTPISTQASRIANQIEQIRYDYGATIGVWINRDGSYDPIGQRRPTADEVKLLDSLGSLLNSVRALNLNSPDMASRRTNAARVQEDTRTVEQAWRRVPLSSNLNQKINNVVRDSRELANLAVR